MGPQWSRDRALKGRTRKRKAKIRRKGLRIAPGKVERKGLYHLSLIRLGVLLINFFIFCDLNV